MLEILVGVYACISVLILSFITNGKKSIPFLDSVDEKHRLNPIQSRKTRIYFWCVSIFAAILWPLAFVFLWFQKNPSRR